MFGAPRMCRRQDTNAATTCPERDGAQTEVFRTGAEVDAMSRISWPSAVCIRAVSAGSNTAAFAPSHHAHARNHAIKKSFSNAACSSSDNDDRQATIRVANSTG